MFDNHLLVLKPFDEMTQPNQLKFDHELFCVQIHNLPLAIMNCQIREFVRESIGRVVDVDVEEDDVGWGVCLRVRIECDLMKVLAWEGLLILMGGVCGFL